jgi:malate synthase
VGRARSDGRYARAEDRPSEDRRQHRLGAVADRGDVLHATHYHAVDVFARQADRAPTRRRSRQVADRAAGRGPQLEWEEIRDELDNNAQGISWAMSCAGSIRAIGCSKVPDIHDIGLMEDRATLRISSQHMANWLLHGVCTAGEVDAAFARMAAKVDAQNDGDPLYRPLRAKALR